MSAFIELISNPEVQAAFGTIATLVVSIFVGKSKKFGGTQWKTAKRMGLMKDDE